MGSSMSNAPSYQILKFEDANVLHKTQVQVCAGAGMCVCAFARVRARARVCTCAYSEMIAERSNFKWTQVMSHLSITGKGPLRHCSMLPHPCSRMASLARISRVWESNSPCSERKNEDMPQSLYICIDARKK